MKKNKKSKYLFNISNKEKVLIIKSLLKVTMIMISLSVILKLLGLDIFGADNSNKILQPIINFLDKNNLTFFINHFFIFIEFFIIFRLSCNNKNIKIYYITALFMTFLTGCLQYALFNFFNPNTHYINNIYLILTFLFLLLPAIIIDIKIKVKKINSNNLIKKLLNNIWQRIKKPLFWIAVITIYQLIAMFLRNITYTSKNESMYHFLLEFDYIILLLLTYYLFIKKKSNFKIKKELDISVVKFLNKVPNFSDFKKTYNNLITQIIKFKHTKKSEKILIIIYSIFFILSELFNLTIIIFVAYLNDTLIECFFIITSFMITRKVFGAFHLDSAIKCWIISNIAFFILSKLTLSINFTFIIPVLFGILLAFITSKFIKNLSYELYRGIPKEDLLNICHNKKLNKLEIEILVDYYSNRYSINKIAIKNHYSDRNIKRLKTNAVNKLNIN